MKADPSRLIPLKPAEVELFIVWSKSYVFQNKGKIMGKRAKWGSFPVSSGKTLHIYVPFVCILCSWIYFI